jgi:methylmalonyl-CoA mutase C-terminal domain/subunit
MISSLQAGQPPRILLAKPGLDGHDRGVKVVARALRDRGFEVIYLGLRSRPDAIAKAVVEEDVSLVGLSISSGGHIGATREVLAALRDAGAGDVPVVVGGTIPAGDVDKLQQAGVAAVFPVGGRLDDIVDEVSRLVSGLPEDRKEVTA